MFHVCLLGKNQFLVLLEQKIILVILMMNKCATLQDSYENGEEVGTLQCGHGYYVECKRMWLLQIKVCAIYSSTKLWLFHKWLEKLENMIREWSYIHATCVFFYH